MNEYRSRFVVYLRALALGLAVAGAAGPLHAEAPPQKTGVPPTKIGVPAAKISVPTAPVVAVAPFTADTAAPAKRQGMVSVGGLNWRCQGLRCTTSGAPTLLGIGSCQALAREVGQIRRFASAKRALSTAELSQCNLGISAGAAASIGTHTTPIAGLPSVSSPSPSKGGAPARTLSPARTQAPKGSMLPPPVRTGGGFAPATPRILQGGIAGATSSGPAQPAINIPKATQLTQLRPAVTRQLLLSRTERFTGLKREVGRKRAKAEADAARAKTENEKTRGAAALKARRDAERAAVAARRDLEQFCTAGGDGDGDGHVSSACTGGDDCDDADATRYPGATEICDLYGHDEDCNATTYGTKDDDGDGHMSSACFNTDGRGSVTAGLDCDDSRAEAHPGAAETCDLLDNNCDGRIDEGQTLPYYLDADSDGHGSRATRMNVCPSEVTAAADQRDAGGTGLPWVTSGDDCDDSNPGIWNAVGGCQ